MNKKKEHMHITQYEKKTADITTYTSKLGIAGGSSTTIVKSVAYTNQVGIKIAYSRKKGGQTTYQESIRVRQETRVVISNGTTLSKQIGMMTTYTHKCASQITYSGSR